MEEAILNDLRGQLQREIRRRRVPEEAREDLLSTVTLAVLEADAIQPVPHPKALALKILGDEIASLHRKASRDRQRKEALSIAESRRAERNARSSLACSLSEAPAAEEELSGESLRRVCAEQCAKRLQEAGVEKPSDLAGHVRTSARRALEMDDEARELGEFLDFIERAKQWAAAREFPGEWSRFVLHVLAPLVAKGSPNFCRLALLTGPRIEASRSTAPRKDRPRKSRSDTGKSLASRVVHAILRPALYYANRLPDPIDAQTIAALAVLAAPDEFLPLRAKPSVALKKAENTIRTYAKRCPAGAGFPRHTADLRQSRAQEKQAIRQEKQKIRPLLEAADAMLREWRRVVRTPAKR